MTTSLRALTLALAAMTTTTLAGCTLYFGDGGDGGDRGWEDDGGPTDGSGGGYYCTTDRDCAAGCFCDEDKGVCEEAGFCDDDTDCGDGYVCDTSRDSCVPGDQCTTDTDCTAGSFCQDGTCQASCVCASDEQATAAGYGYCDEDRGTCMPPNAAGSCAGTAPGSPPQCGAGQVPLILNGAYTGQCSAIADCDVAPSCPAFQTEADCLNTSDTENCGATFVGLNCHMPDGSSCTSGPASGCTCTSYQYSSCQDLTPNGGRVLQSTGEALPSMMF